MRLDQFISQTTRLSRKQAKIAIKQKRVSVNHQVNRDQSLHIKNSDHITLDQQRLSWPEELYIMLNKPAGFCCSHNDDGYPSALTLIAEQNKKLHFAGRLDADTTGLVLLSSDGNWCHRVTSPKQKASKRKYKHYLVESADPLPTDAIEQLCTGVLLTAEAANTLPATLKQYAENSYELAICEGKYHQVKRMFAAVGNKVTALHRKAIGSIELDCSLKPGDYRKLTQEEVESFND